MASRYNEEEEEEKVFIFLDWANVYREGRNLHWRQCSSYFERFEGCVPTKRIDELTDDERENHKTQLEKIKTEKPEKKTIYLSNYFIQAEHLKSICSRCEENGKEPPKEQCFAFVSHPPGVSIANHPALILLDQYFTIEYHERIEWATNKEKEKGVDVALAIQIITTIYEEQDNNTNFRIVIISSDSDFAPVVKKLTEPKVTKKIATKKISVEVWGWMSNASNAYVSYLKNLETKCSKTVLYYLDDYMYQISYRHKLEYRWCISMMPYKNADEHICKWYKRLSHYTLVKHLIDSHGFEQGTTDFIIHRKNNRIIISFLTSGARDKFKDFSKKFRRLHYYNYLCQKEYDYRQWKQQQLAASQANKMNQPQSNMESAVDLEGDDGIIFQH